MYISRLAPKVNEKKNLTKPVTPQPFPSNKENQKFVEKENEKIVEKEVEKAVVTKSKVTAPGCYRIRTNTVSASTSKHIEQTT